MNRLALTHLCLLFLPAFALAFFAFRVAEQDYEEGVEARRHALETVAASLASRLKAAYAGAARQAADTMEQVREALISGESLVTAEPVGFARDGEWSGYSLPREERDLSIPLDDLERYRLSLRGGDHYQFVAEDPELAVDAYAFYLPRIRARPLRTRLRFRIACAALDAGRERLGRGLLARLMTETPVSLTEEGLPIDVLAALRLADLANSGSDEDVRVQTAVRDHFRRRRQALPTSVLRLVKQRAPAGDSAMSRWIERREGLEWSLERHPALLVDREAVLEGDWLTLALSLGEGVPSDVRAILRLPVAHPLLDAGQDFVAYLEPFSPGSSADRDAREVYNVARHPVHLGSDGPVLAHVEVTDARAVDILMSLRSKLNLQRTLIGLLVAMTLAGGGALVYYLGRERKLARLRTQLLANVSHELKTPATSIRMLSEMLAGDDLGETKAKRFADLLHGESLRLGRIIENVLEFSRLERGRRKFTKESVDLRRVVLRVFESFSYRTKGQTLDLEQGGAHLGGSPIVVVTNQNAVECILFNLLDNAVKYTAVKAAGGSGFRPRVRLTVELDRERSAVSVSVADNGIGITPRDEEKIFEEFYRARFEDYGVQGTGLGLSISRALARRLGGEITVESTPGNGSTFTLTLPMHSSPADAADDDADDAADDDDPARPAADRSTPPADDRSEGATVARSPRSQGRRGTS